MDQDQDQPKDTNPPRSSGKQLATFRVEIAPGRTVLMELPREAVGRYSVIKLNRMPDGTILPVYQSLNRMQPINRKLPLKLGLAVDMGTLHVLVRSGLVEGCKFTPSVTLIDVHSLMSHITGCTGEDARKYWTREKQDIYSEAWRDYHSHSQGMTDRPRRAKKAKPAKSAGPARAARVPAAKAPRPARRTIQPASHPDQMELFPDPQP